MGSDSEDSFAFLCSSCFLNKVIEIVYYGEKKRSGGVAAASGNGKKKGEFSTKKGLLEHMKKMHPHDFPQDFSCPWTECGMKMGSAIFLLDHMMEQHLETFGYVSGESAKYDDWCYFVGSEAESSSYSVIPSEDERAVRDGKMIVTDSFFDKYPHLRRYLKFICMYFGYLREKAVDISKIGKDSRNTFIHEECSPMAILIENEAESLLRTWNGSRFCTVPDSVLAQKTGGSFLTEYGSWKPPKNDIQPSIHRHKTSSPAPYLSLLWFELTGKEDDFG